MLSQAQAGSAKNIVATLRREVWVAQQSVSSGSGSFGFGNSTAGQGKALADILEHLSSAETVWLARVQSGERDFSWWLDAVEVERAALSSYVDTAQSYGIIASVRGALSATVVDVKDIATTATSVGFESSKWLLVGLVAFAVLYVVSFAKAVRT